MDRVFINTDDILKFVEHSLMSDRTDLLYDDTSIKEPDLFPTAAECEASYPNPSGYSTGMEDSNLSGGSMLEALILLYNAYPTGQYLDPSSWHCTMVWAATLRNTAPRRGNHQNAVRDRP